MSKNTEILIEIMSDERAKLEILVSEQSKLINTFSNTIERAEKIEIKTHRLEEVIEYWNKLFTKQKNQIRELQNQQIEDNRRHRIITYVLLTIIALTLIFKII